jgi:hypothetical protein
MSNRLVGETFTGFEHSGHSFTAPPRTSITHLRWAGRMARENCDWTTNIKAVPSNANVLGYPARHFCDATNFDNRGWPVTVRTPAGTTGLEQLVVCFTSKCSPGAALHAQWVEVTIDDPVPPSVSVGGPLVSGRWVSGRTGRPPEVHVASADSAGVQRIETALGARGPDKTFPCNWSQSRPCPQPGSTSLAPGVANLHDGRHTLSVSSWDSAGNSTVVTRSVFVDNTPPDPVVPKVTGGHGWRRTNGFSASWTNPAGHAAPITRAHWKLCSPDGSCRWGGIRAAQDIHEIPQILAPAPGEFELYVWLEDAAGNQREANAPLSVPLRFDPDPPQVVFAASDSADPLRVAVNAVDHHSGLADGEIEMRAVGGRTWHGLRTERQGSQLVGYVDDERFRDGAYEFRARAVDNAGNEASTGKRVDGSAARLRLPARIDTRLAVGILRGTGKRRRYDASFVTRYGRRVRVSGRLTNTDGQPIDLATVEASQRNADRTNTPIGLATTDRAGRFRYVLRAIRNRGVIFRYGGSRRIGSAKSLVRMRVPAASSIRVSRAKVRNGEGVKFSGRVATRPFPPGGKLIEMQAHFRNRWRTFSTVRSDSTGRWRFPYRFGATLGRVVYWFRVRLPSEGGYPFATGRSRKARVVVIGP